MDNSTELNKISYDSATESYDTHVNSETSYNAFAETPYMKELLSQQQGEKILDFCCGTGRYSNWLAKQFKDVVGIDYSNESVEFAKQKAEELQLKNIKYLTGSFEQLKDCQNQFDGINWGMGLHYFEELDSVLDSLQYCLKPNGWLILSTVHPIVWSGDYIQDEDKQYGRTVLDYFNSEVKETKWRSVTSENGEPFITRNYPHNFQSLTTAFSSNNFLVEKILEPQPKIDNKSVNEDMYNRLVNCPQFVILKAIKRGL